MGLLDIAPELTKIVDHRQLSKLGLKTHRELDYWYKDIPCKFPEQFTSVDVRIMVTPKLMDGKIQGCWVRIQPTNLRRKISDMVMYNNQLLRSEAYRPDTIRFVPTQMAIVYLEALGAMMTEGWAKEWFVQNVQDSRIDFELSRLFKE